MTCAYCKDITVCVICGKGYAEAVLAEATSRVKPTEADSMNRLRVQAEDKAALYRRALLLACDGDVDKVAFFVSEAADTTPKETP